MHKYDLCFRESQFRIFGDSALKEPATFLLANGKTVPVFITQLNLEEGILKFTFHGPDTGSGHGEYSLETNGGGRLWTEKEII